MEGSEKNSIPQESVLPLTMFLAYANDMTEGVNSYICQFADDTKLIRKVENHKDCEELHNYINRT